MYHTLPIAILDYEASSLSDNSYPIEAGWALIMPNLSIASGALLIRPHRSWTDWSTKSERIHGLSRNTLFQLGVPVEAVAARLSELFADLHGPVLSADPDYEAFWSERLYGAANATRAWTLSSYHQAIDHQLAALNMRDRSLAAARLQGARPHSAEADAVVFAQLLADLILQNGTTGQL